MLSSLRASMLCLLLATLPASAMAAERPFVLDDSMGFENITTYGAYLVDPDASLTVDEVSALPLERFSPVGEASLYFGINPGAVWVRFVVQNRTQENSFVLEFNNPRLERIDLFWRSGGGAWSEDMDGTDLPLENRLAKHVLPAMRVRVPQGEEVVVFARVKHGGSMRFQVHICHNDLFRQMVTNRTAANFGMAGAMLAMAVFNLVVFLQLRERSYLYLSAAVLTFLAFTLALNGAGYLWVWPDAHWWSRRSVTTTSMLHQVFLGLFFISFMRPMRRQMPWLERCGWAMTGGSMALVLLALSDWEPKYYLIAFFGGLIPILFEVAALAAYWQGYRPAAHFSLAWGISVGGAIFMYLINLGVIDFSYQREAYVPLGYLISVAVWNISLAERLRVSEISAREGLEAQVRERTRELQQALDEVKTLSGLLPMCSECKKIRDDKGYWQGVEQYINEHTGARFTHGMCPECFSQMYPAYAERMSAMEAEPETRDDTAG